LSRHSADDCAPLAEAVNRSFEELRRWMPWAQSRATEASIAEFLEGSRQAWDDGREFGYAIRESAGPDPAPAGIIGACGLHLRSGPGVAEIGYWVRSDATGRGVATAAAQALTAAALDLPEISRIEIHCDADNRASRSIPPKVGFRLERIDPRPPTPRTPGETDRIMIWVRAGDPAPRRRGPS
jgi:RimJ/RimL family protein N-acetyltransferase